MDHKKTLKIAGGLAIGFGAAVASGYLILFSHGSGLSGISEEAHAIDPPLAAIIDSNLAAIDGLQNRLMSLQPDEVTLPNVAHAIGAFGSGHELTINGERVGALQWLLELAAHKPLIGGQGAVAQGASGLQFRRPRRIAEYGLFEGHLAQSLFYLSEAVANPDAVAVRVAEGDTASLARLCRFP